METITHSEMSSEEWTTRVDLAAAYRLVASQGWDDLVFTHITAKVPSTEHFLINPYGQMFDEITASSLVKVDLNGNKVAKSEYDINPAGFMIHSCIHGARDDAGCVMHTHSLNGIAVSAQEKGLLALSQFSLTVLPFLGYHDYEGFALKDEEQPRLVKDLGKNYYMILRNHGLLTVGRSVAEAFVAMHRFEAACKVQIKAQSGGGQLREVCDEIQTLAVSQIGQVRGAAGINRVWPGLLRRIGRLSPGFDS